MNLPITVTQDDLLEILLNVAPSRPVFIWGAPGIGKSALVERFAAEIGLPCVSLLGSQLAPEDIIGIPQIRGETSEFLPPKMIARKKPYVLFLDELNACSQEVQKAFYSLIHERRIGEYHLPEGSIVVGAGNRIQDSAIVKTMSSALINRMFHVQMKADARQWIKWAQRSQLHPWVIDYIIQRPDHLFSEAPKTEEPFSTPRSWHMLSDALAEYGAGKRELSSHVLKMLVYGCLTPSHAGMFLAYIKSLANHHMLDDIIAEKAKWPSKAEDRDVPFVRIIFCDAEATDAGYMSPENIAGRVEITGRGGTILQPGIDALEKARDFPPAGPILVITDGYIEEDLKIRREHAFLIPNGSRLPFRPKGKVFYMENKEPKEVRAKY